MWSLKVREIEISYIQMDKIAIGVGELAPFIAKPINDGFDAIFNQNKPTRSPFKTKSHSNDLQEGGAPRAI